jgi:hypothetical protein
MCDAFIQKVIDNLNNMNFKYIVHPLTGREMNDLLGEQIIRRTENDLCYENSNTYIAIDLFETEWTRVCFKVMKDDRWLYVEFNYSKKRDAKLIPHYLNFMMIYLHHIENIFMKNPIQFRVIFFLSDEKKRFEKGKLFKQEIIRSDNINSGVTFLYPDLPLIVIYRKEELLKVLIHELLHLYRTHPVDKYDNYYDDFCKNNWKIQRTGSLNLYEAYVEVFAVIIYSCSYAYKIHKSKTNINHVKRVLEKEKTYSKSIYDDIRSLQRDNYLKEDTNVFAYFYIKYALLQHLDTFFASISPKNYCIYDHYARHFLDNAIDCAIKSKPTKKKIKNIKRTHFRMTISDVIP